MTQRVVFRWDLDKTYLVSHFESLRQLIRIPFQRAEDKISIPGVVAVIRGLRRSAVEKGREPRVFFLSASPPQIGTAIRDKLELDGIAYDGITFKDQVGNLIRGRFDAVLEQIGYKLEQMLRDARETPAHTHELLFGDDWESDPFIYSLYADIVAGRVGREETVALLERAQVNRRYVARIAELVEQERAQLVVDGIFILRQRAAPTEDLNAFGARMLWFDNYFECALGLYARGHLDRAGVVEVADEIGLGPQQLALSFEAIARRPGYPREYLSPVRRRLVAARLMAPVAKGRWGRRVLAALRRLAGRTPAPVRRDHAVPDYGALVASWSYRGRKDATKEVLHERKEPGGSADHRGERE